MRMSPLTPGLLLLRDQGGTVAVEFAFIMPVLVTLFLGSFEITNLMMADLKLQAAVETAGNLATQALPGATTLTPTNVADFATAADMVMSPLVPAPYPTKNGSLQTANTAGLQLAFASITYNGSGVPSVAWHYEVNGATAISTGSLNTALLEELGSSTTDSVIMVTATYVYNSPLSYVLGTQYTLSDTVYNRPRYVSQVTCPSCT